ncbi:Enoyl-[acyl-carrier-protein] reductase [NADH], chloroplastic [Chlamydiales bacterium STE3]|nr:Enoyl-[acyl-carrier-protein] reductase [NADH], chloroplastic [Chlamydiales bacterium STE3]
MLQIDLKGKKAFIAGVGDDQGFGWAIAKSLAEAGAEILIGTWTPLLKIFTTGLAQGKFDTNLSDGSQMQVSKVYALDASFDTPNDVPSEIKDNKRYKDVEGYTVSEVADAIKRDFGSLDILVHSLANGPEVQKALLDTSRAGYLAAISASSYSYISLLRYLGPLMPPGSAALSLTYIAAEKVVPGYGGGMSSAKAALESDTQVLAYEAGRKWNIRINTISAGPFRSRAGRAIGFIDNMITYAKANAPLTKELDGAEVGNTAAFLLSPLASGITGSVVYVDNGMHVMGVGMDSPAFDRPLA